MVWIEWTSLSKSDLGLMHCDSLMRLLGFITCLGGGWGYAKLKIDVIIFQYVCY